MHSSESEGGVLCRHVELGRNSLFDSAEETALGGVISSILKKKYLKSFKKQRFDSALQLTAKLVKLMDTRKNSVNSVRSFDEKLFPGGISLEHQQGKSFHFL